uniref:FLYWCH-type domain-containing protein n=1 Tax=Ditylenchus dipsaci TaxID=166011 RepID=A0A915DVN3_9BILA
MDEIAQCYAEAQPEANMEDQQEAVIEDQPEEVVKGTVVSNRGKEVMTYDEHQFWKNKSYKENTYWECAKGRDKSTSSGSRERKQKENARSTFELMRTSCVSLKTLKKEARGIIWPE